MPQDEFNPTFPAAAGSYPKAPGADALPKPAPLGPITSPLPKASSVFYSHLYAAAGTEDFIVAARAPFRSVLRYISVQPGSTHTEGAMAWAIRGLNSLPNTMAQFLTGPLIFPTHVNNPDIPDWAMWPSGLTLLTLPLETELPQNAPLLILGIRNISEDTEGLNLYLIIDPPPGHHP